MSSISFHILADRNPLYSPDQLLHHHEVLASRVSGPGQKEWRLILTLARELDSFCDGDVPPIAIVLGSGLGKLATDDRLTLIEEARPYADFPSLPPKHDVIPGQEAQLYRGFLKVHGKQVPVLLFGGRWHAYEGFRAEECARFVRALRVLGCRLLIQSSASGGVPFHYRPGDVMLVESYQDNIDDKLFYRYPHLAPFGTYFPPMGSTVSPSMLAMINQIAGELNIIGSAKGKRDEPKLFTDNGVYQRNPGRRYETNFEVRMARKLGIQAVGMSSIPEAEAALQAYYDQVEINQHQEFYASPLDLLWFAVITNPASRPGVIPDHTNIKAEAEAAYPIFSGVIAEAAYRYYFQQR